MALFLIRLNLSYLAMALQCSRYMQSGEAVRWAGFPTVMQLLNPLGYPFRITNYKPVTRCIAF